MRRGDLAVIAELTPEQRARLERDAPGLAEALALVAVPAASPAETAHLLLHEIRGLEVAADQRRAPPVRAAHRARARRPRCSRGARRPGVAIEIVRRVAERRARRGGLDREVAPDDVLDYLARTTGLSPRLITLDKPLDANEVEAAFARA